ncbi:GSCOCG00006435001-RA-CDS, partial [Cotesia congregata]
MFQFSLFLRILCLSLVQGQVFLPDMEIVTSSVSNCQEIVASNNDNTALDLSQAGIVRLRKSFINSSSITHIYLNDNNIWKVEDGAFDGLPNLVHVDLTGNLINFSELIFGDKIETLILDQAIRNDEHSFSIFDFNYESCQATFNSLLALKVLDLSGNMLEALPDDWISPELNLQYLYLNDNFFKIMPNIAHLYLSENSLSSLNFLDKIPQTLTHLYLENNKISHFESSNKNNIKVLNNESKTVLDLSNTGVMRLKKSFVNSSLITHLYLTDNNIWKIDEGAFDYLPNLVYLNLTGNLFPLEELNFGGESSIETLILDRAINQHNNLEYYGSNDDCSRVRNYRDQSLNVQNLFTLSISVKLPKLKKLYLRQNNIHIDSIRFIDYLPATLTHLFLDYNLATNFEVESLKNLKTLTLDGNQIGRLCNSYEYCLGLTLKTAVNLENLSVSKSGLQEIESDAFDNLQNLKKLDVSGNQLHKIVKHTFDNLTNLTTLKLDDNQLVTLPDICSLENLEHLSVANNKIRAISKSTFCGLSKLKVLNLSGNALQEISVGAFDELVALEELDLSKNAFVSLPDEWLSPELSLRRLHLNNNMFKNLASLSLSKSKNLQYINIGDNPL